MTHTELSDTPQRQSTADPATLSPQDTFPKGRLSRKKPEEYTIAISGLPIYPSDKAWQPVKDLLRAIIVRNSDGVSVEFGKVSLHNTVTSPIAFCGLKIDWANKVYEYLAGNYWHGSRLTVCLFTDRGVLHAGPCETSFFCKPLTLESISRIKNPNLLLSMREKLQLPQTPPIKRANSRSGRLISTQPALKQKSDSTMNPHDSSVTIHGKINAERVCTGSERGQPQVNRRHSREKLYANTRRHRPETRNQNRDPSAHNSMSWSTPFRAIPTALSNIPLPTLPLRPIPSQQLTLATVPSAQVMTHINPHDTAEENSSRTFTAMNYHCNSVIVHNLHRNTSPHTVAAHFALAGSIERCEFDFAHNFKRPVAVIAYRTAAEAETAIARFNGTQFSGRRIWVVRDSDDDGTSRAPVEEGVEADRVDKVAPPAKRGPIIVDGSDGFLGG